MDNKITSAGLRRHLPLLIVFSLGCVLTGFASWISFTHAKEEQQLQFQQYSQEYFMVIQEIFKDTTHYPEEVASFYAASETVERQEFHIFTKSILALVQGM